MAERIEYGSNSKPVNRGCAEGTEPTKMADLLGESPNRYDDVFRELERMEAILQSMPDFAVDDLDDDPQVDSSSAPTPDI